MHDPRPARLGGVACGLASAALFGLGAPLAKLLVPRVGGLLFAGLLYLGAGGGLALLSLWRRVRDGGPTEARLGREELPTMVAVVLAGGVLGPALLLWGLARVSGVGGSLLLNLEAPLTIALAVAAFREHVGRVEGAGATLIVCGAALLGSGEGSAQRFDAWGALAIAAACAAWALDNNLTARLSLKDPVQIARIKSLSAGAVSTVLGLSLGQRAASAGVVGAALLLGVFAYGLSLVLHIRAQRTLGAARQAALFSVAPFVGALAALPVLDEPLHGPQLLAGALMACGVALLVRARHSHQHTHTPLDHEHLHVHDAHHQHPHAGPVREPHSHPHRHVELTHEHPHLPDGHHRHEH